MKEEYVKWHSDILGREMEMLVYGTGGLPIILFPTSMGKYYQNKDFKLIDSVEWFINQGLVKIYCPDSIDTDSWYNKNIHPAQRVANHMLYDRYIHEEVLPYASNETGHSRMAFAGCSFGAYHATNFAFKHPEVAAYVFNMGGAFDIKMQLDGYYDDNCYFNNPPDYLPDAHNPDLWKMGIVFGVGEYDFCVNANVRLSEICNQKGINNWLDIVPGGVHDWPAWREMFPRYLSRINF